MDKYWTEICCTLVQILVTMSNYLPSLPVSDDQLSLASSNGHQTVHSLDASLHGLPHRDTRDDSGGLQTNTPTGFGTQGTLEGKS